eukprot:TRINITY_DN1727_c0_g1_i1.p1 TRINITY_DN1727_c0_g1~~TRINITY_DN1727_c0_g1_i1.p1  ORF type:complete len:330 (-),score=81.83 TRINITY_DN1727_c0_g1_i1:770-1759(-)
MSDKGENVELICKEHNIKRYFSDPCLIGLSRHIIDLEDCGPISVYVQGDIERMKDGPVIMTIHDVGSSFHSMVEFSNHADMQEVKSRCLFLHVSVYGQSHKASDLTHDFPSLEKLSLNLVTVLDQMQIKNVVLIGDGAGANIALRFGLFHPTRTSGLILLQCSAGVANVSVMERLMDAIRGKDSSVNVDEPQLNQKNIHKYAEAYKARTSIIDDIADKVNFDVLLVNGSNSDVFEESSMIYSKIKPGLASIIKIDDVADPLKDAPEKVADPLILFVQGLGWMPTAKRKCSRDMGKGSMEEVNDRPQLTRRISMEQYDTPNIRRFSLERH